MEKEIREKFMQWYKLRFKQTLPIYLPNQVKKELKKLFELETKIKYII